MNLRVSYKKKYEEKNFFPILKDNEERSRIRKRNQLVRGTKMSRIPTLNSNNVDNVFTKELTKSSCRGLVSCLIQVPLHLRHFPRTTSMK
jgi:hypothetical protein